MGVTLLVLALSWGCGSSPSDADGGPGDGGQDDAGCPFCIDVVTYHNDNARTGQYLMETRLNQANVNAAHFGKLSFWSTDGKVDAQPLYMDSVQISSMGIAGKHHVVYVATEHDSVYAFDTESDAGTPLWKTSLLDAGETPSDPRGCDQVVPEIGITATPVIDPDAGTLYTVAMSKVSGAGAYVQRLHALDLGNGHERPSSPVIVQATYLGIGDESNGTHLVFDPAQHKERAGLALVNGTVYTFWSSHCDIRPYTSWVIAYRASDLQQTAVLNLVPNGNEGAVWASGAAPAVDEGGSLYAMTGNGTFETTLTNGFPNASDYGNAFVKLDTADGGMTVADYFEPFDGVSDSSTDTDLGSGGVLLLPDSVGSSAHPHLIVGAGKNGDIYLVDRDQMGHFQSASNSQIVQEVADGLQAEFGMAAYFQGAIYYGAVSDTLKRFTVRAGALSTHPVNVTPTTFGYPGTTPSISANASSLTATAIVWAHENSTPAVLHAYSAWDLHELYNSNQAAHGRDQLGAGNKFIVPTIANGKVYVGATNGVAVFGLLPP